MYSEWFKTPANHVKNNDCVTGILLSMIGVGWTVGTVITSQVSAVVESGCVHKCFVLNLTVIYLIHSS